MAKLYTIGYSTRSLEEFINILQIYKITLVVDVRTSPKSHHVPWFNRENLKEALKKEKMGYMHLPQLGGLRKPNKNSVNKGWRNAHFRGYADYMQTADFFRGLKELNSLIKKGAKITIMCAEAVPWRCHRTLIADAEVTRHYEVLEIINKTSIRKHKLTNFAVVNRSKRPMQIYYPKQ